MDFSLAPESLHISSIPDILILPSDMKYFVKVKNVPSICLFKASLNTEVAATAYMAKDSKFMYYTYELCILITHNNSLLSPKEGYADVTKECLIKYSLLGFGTGAVPWGRR